MNKYSEKELYALFILIGWLPAFLIDYYFRESDIIWAMIYGFQIVGIMVSIRFIAFISIDIFNIYQTYKNKFIKK